MIFEKREPGFVEHRDGTFAPMDGQTRWYIDGEEVPAAEWAIKFAIHHGNPVQAKPDKEQP